MQTAPCPEIETFDNLSVYDAQSFEGNIYPNPTTDLINIISPLKENTLVYITDLHGRKIISGINIQANFTNKISLNGLAPGIYILTMMIDQK